MYISLTLLHSERPKLYTILAFLSAIGLKKSLVADLLSLTVLTENQLLLYFLLKVVRSVCTAKATYILWQKMAGFLCTICLKF